MKKVEKPTKKSNPAKSTRTKKSIFPEGFECIQIVPSNEESLKIVDDFFGKKKKELYLIEKDAPPPAGYSFGFVTDGKKILNISFYQGDFRFDELPTTSKERMLDVLDSAIYSIIIFMEEVYDEYQKANYFQSKTKKKLKITELEKEDFQLNSDELCHILKLVGMNEVNNQSTKNKVADKKLTKMNHSIMEKLRVLHEELDIE